MPDGSREHFLYDGAGRLASVLVEEHGSIRREDFAFDGDRPLVSFHDDRVQWSASWSPDNELVGLRLKGVKYVPLSDTTRSIRSWWDSRRLRYAQHAEYDPDGRASIFDSSGALSCRESSLNVRCASDLDLPFGYKSAWRAPSSGILRMGARWYLPSAGQFLTPDPSGPVDSFNQYAFAAFDPINLWDPAGLNSQGTGSQGLVTQGQSPGGKQGASGGGKPGQPPKPAQGLVGPLPGGIQLPTQPTTIPGVPAGGSGFLAALLRGLSSVGGLVLIGLTVGLWPATAHAPGPSGRSPGCRRP
jgi:RHS repeat-associated protein